MPVFQTRSTVRFGLFELDTEVRELYRKGIRVKLARQPIELLAALVEQPGQAVSREALRQRLWPPDTYVDYEHGLNKTVRKLREALGDSAESPRYIETLPKTGYRFIAPVIRADASAPEPDTSLHVTPLLAASDPVSRSPEEAGMALEETGHSRAIPILLVLLALAAIAGGAGLWSRNASRVSRSPAAKTANPRAEEAYLHGRYLWLGEHPLESLDYFKRAVEVQPDYAPAWTGIALYYGAVIVRGRMDPAEGLDVQEEAAAKAVRFDPSLPEAHLAMCGSIFLKTWQFQAANVECNRALQLDPRDAEVYHFQSKMLAAVNRTQDALETQRTGSRLDPLSRPWALGQALLQARRYDEALSETRTRLESFPHDPTLLRLLSDIYRARGNGAQCVEYLAQSYQYGGDEPYATQVREAFRDGGYPAVVRWHLARLVKQSANTYVSPVDLAADYARLGDREHALEMLNRALDGHATGLLWIRCEPAFDGLASDPRYRKILAQLPAA